jgi:spoIIIJ-associated protein
VDGIYRLDQEANMSDKRTSLEVIAPSIEEAVEKGLTDLGLPREAVDVEVLDTGSKGLFGLGTRLARVRLTIRSGSEEEMAPQAEAAPVAAEAISGEEMGAAARESLAAFASEAEISPEALVKAASTDARQAIEEEIALSVARDTMEELLDRMKVRAQITTRFTEPDDAHSRAALLVDVRGEDLSILIGPKAETLNALQYITSLIVSKELGRSVPLVVDVEGYRARRTQQIRQLARRMADQAVKTGRRQVLEPMPANERRLVHIELRSYPEVTTESVGEEPRRKVTIIPVEDKG